MNVKGILRILLVFALLSMNVGCDQISKKIVRARVADDERIGLLNHYVTLTRIENEGAFLSLGSSMSPALRVILLTFLPLGVLILALVYVLTRKNLSSLSITGICFVVGGGIGNIYDRIVYGSVTDFLHINFVIFQTGIFNMADVSIMAGMLFVLLDAYLKDMRRGTTTSREL